MRTVRRNQAIAAFILLAVGNVCGATSETRTTGISEASSGISASARPWISLLNGTNLDAWNMDGREGVWGVNQEGELCPTKKGRNLYTRKRYCDFELDLEYNMGFQSNSGVFIRMHKLDDEYKTGMEVQIADNVGYHEPWNAKDANAALYDMVAPRIDVTRPAGEWNKLHIVATNSLIVIELNNQEVVRADVNLWKKARQSPDGARNKCPYPIAALPQEGFIGLQNYYTGAPVRFRNIRVRALTDRQPLFTGEEPIDKVLRRLVDAE
jgi:hypothetical protein